MAGVNYQKWARRELWKLSEAASLVAGFGPQGLKVQPGDRHGVPTSGGSFLANWLWMLLAATYANEGETAKATADYAQQAERHLYPGLRKAGIPEN